MAMLPPRAPALNREQAIELYEQLITALLEAGTGPTGRDRS
jgi:hypothetical protein